MKKSYLGLLLIICLSSVVFINANCNNDEFGFNTVSLSAEEKKTIKDFSEALKKDKAKTLSHLAILLKAKATFEPITEQEARGLFDDYQNKRKTRLQPVLRSLYRDVRFEDTRSIIVRTDSLYNYLLSAMNSGKETAVRIVMGGYPRDLTQHNPQAGRINQKYSGQFTVFFVTAIRDSIISGGQKRYIWKDSVKAVGGKNIYEGFGFYNHGELCPDSCGITSF
jgi:hypothetical protein